MSYDITKCGGGTCPLKADCYRFTSETLGRQDFFGSMPYNVQTQTCEHFWDNTTQIRERAYQIWIDGGCQDNQAIDNWEKAKAQILAELGIK